MNENEIEQQVKIDLFVPEAKQEQETSVINKLKQKKDFWDFSLNIVKGCGKKPPCPYCYARRFVKRLGFAEKVAMAEMKFRHGTAYQLSIKRIDECNQLMDDIYNFKPTFFEYVFAQKLRKKPAIYFFSMSDPAYWEQEWYERIVQKIAGNMQHTFVVLTKQPEVYIKYQFPCNTILGVTCINQLTLNFFSNTLHYWYRPNKLLLVIEPIQEKIKINAWARRMIDWIHVGQESGNRTGRIHATKEMIQPFFDLKDIPVFMKDNLAGICGDRPLRKEFPAWTK